VPTRLPWYGNRMTSSPARACGSASRVAPQWMPAKRRPPPNCSTRRASVPPRARGTPSGGLQQNQLGQVAHWLMKHQPDTRVMHPLHTDVKPRLICASAHQDPKFTSSQTHPSCPTVVNVSQHALPSFHTACPPDTFTPHADPIPSHRMPFPSLHSACPANSKR